MKRIENCHYTNALSLITPMIFNSYNVPPDKDQIQSDIYIQYFGDQTTYLTKSIGKSYKMFLKRKKIVMLQ